MRKALGIRNELVIGNIGRFCAQKNQLFLIDIFSSITMSLPNALLILVGEGGDKELLLNKVDRLGLKDNVLFLEPRTDIQDLLQAIDIVIAPSLCEGLSLSLLEAQASGVPVFTSSSVSRECRMSDYIYFYDLSMPSSMWAQKILDVISKCDKRESRVNYIRQKGFDISAESRKMEKYLTC